MAKKDTQRRPSRRPDHEPEPSAEAATSEAEESERRLGRGVALGLPAVAWLAAVGAGLLAGVGPALLVLAAGALLGAIALLWASVRTLSGDAPLAQELELSAARRGGGELAEEKRRVLRALKDLESEHALGKIDDADYQAVATRYREEAKSLMRQMDAEVAPLLDEAERVASEYLSRRHPKSATAASDPNAATAAAVDPESATADGAVDPKVATAGAVDARRACPSCATSNEADAAFCKQCGAAMKAAPSASSREKADAPA
jgi:hypothetical protein